MILEPIWEHDFVDESIGYRPGRSPRQATQELAEALHDGKHRWVVEADIKGFFAVHRQRRATLEVRMVRTATDLQMAQPPQPAAQLHMDQFRRSMGTLENALAEHRRKTVAICWTSPAPPAMKSPTNSPPIMIEVPPARIPEEPGAVIPHAGICEGGVGQPTFLP